MAEWRALNFAAPDCHELLMRLHLQRRALARAKVQVETKTNDKRGIIILRNLHDFFLLAPLSLARTLYKIYLYINIILYS